MSINYLIKRINVALEIIQEGNAFDVDGLLFYLNKDQEFEITGFTKWSLDSLTKAKAISELEESKKRFYEIVNLSVALKEFIKNRVMIFKLNISDAGSSLRICYEKNDLLHWVIDIK